MFHLSVRIDVIEFCSCSVESKSVNIHISVCIKVAVIINSSAADTLNDMSKIIEYLMTICIKVDYFLAIRMVSKFIFHRMSVVVKVVGVCTVTEKAVFHDFAVTYISITVKSTTIDIYIVISGSVGFVFVFECHTESNSGT